MQVSLKQESAHTVQLRLDEAYVGAWCDFQPKEDKTPVLSESKSNHWAWKWPVIGFGGSYIHSIHLPDVVWSSIRDPEFWLSRYYKGKNLIEK